MGIAGGEGGVVVYRKRREGGWLAGCPGMAYNPSSTGPSLGETEGGRPIHPLLLLNPPPP